MGMIRIMEKNVLAVWQVLIKQAISALYEVGSSSVQT